MRGPMLAGMAGLLIAAGPAPAPSAEAARYASCLGLAATDPVRAVETASVWRIEGGGPPARHCLGVAYARQGKFLAATDALEAAARDAQAAGSALAGTIYGQAGNAALAADDAARALDLLNSALSLNPGPAAQGALLVDRARASVALGKTTEARADLDTAVTIAPNDADAWLLRATLARRETRNADAEAAIATAAKLAPDSAEVALEQGNIAAIQGKGDEARAAWTRAVTLAKDSDAGRTAAAALKSNGM
ncbi:MAG: tetratricopeptide repeat protein [Alphaproteobacteria bacterium]|nr:tetratricopeptide repeat protein [Alphaproteobacteria bacterium]